MTEPTNELAERMEALAKTVLNASTAMESCDWSTCQRLFQEAARQSRFLGLLERQQEKEGSD